MALIVFKWPEIVSMGIISWGLESEFQTCHPKIFYNRKISKLQGKFVKYWGKLSIIDDVSLDRGPKHST